MTALAVAFWAAAALVGWTLVGFPLACAAVAALRPRPVRRAPIRPELTVVICAHDEADRIVAKLDNLEAQEYPPDRLRVIVASDGSTDGTVEAARARPRRFGSFEVLDLPRTGKNGALRAALERAVTDIVVCTDADALLAPDALARLVAPFADPTVGAVAGHQRTLEAGGPDADHSVAGERWHRRMETALKRLESATGSAVGATGALYAVRRALIDGIPDDVTDDFWCSTAAVVAGRRLVFAADAVAYEPVAGTWRAEHRRKERLIARGLRGVWGRRRLADPRRTGWYAVVLVTHKVLRRLLVVPALTMAVTAPLLWPRGRWYRLATGAEVALAAAVAVAAARPRGRLARSPVGVVVHALSQSVAAVRAAARSATGRAPGRWDPARTTPGPEGSPRS